jgi:hypothetical protein
MSALAAQRKAIANATLTLMGEAATIAARNGDSLLGYGVPPYGAMGYGGQVQVRGVLLEGSESLPPSDYSADLNRPRFRISIEQYSDLSEWIEGFDAHGKVLTIGDQHYLIAEIEKGRIFVNLRLREL